jgi:hypothetical protein
VEEHGRRQQEHALRQNRTGAAARGG